MKSLEEQARQVAFAYLAIEKLIDKKEPDSLTWQIAELKKVVDNYGGRLKVQEDLKELAETILDKALGKEEFRVYRRVLESLERIYCA